MLTAFGKAVRIHRQLARLAPSFFDAAVVDRERENRAERQRWMAIWEPVLTKVYGAESSASPAPDDLPHLPHPKTRRAVARRLAEFRFWWQVGELARQRHQQRRPHAIPSLSQLARLMKLAFDLKCLALGLDSPNRIPDKISNHDAFTDFKRAYPLPPEPAPPPAMPAVEPVVDPPVAMPSVTIPVASPGSLPPESTPPRNDAWRRWSRHLRRVGGSP